VVRNFIYFLFWIFHPFNETRLISATVITELRFSPSNYQFLDKSVPLIFVAGIKQILPSPLVKEHKYISTRKNVSFHDCDYEEYHILECGYVYYVTRVPTFRKNLCLYQQAFPKCHLIYQVSCHLLEEDSLYLCDLSVFRCGKG